MQAAFSSTAPGPARQPRVVKRLIGVGLVALAALLAGCATGPTSKSGGGLPSGADGPPINPPADLATVPDAEPRIEPIRPGGPNKPYEVLGHSYEPQTADLPWHERGQASWYGRKFQGRRTASGEIYSMYGMTAAHRTLPIPSYARVRNLRNGREVIVRVNDRGPFHSDRVMDLSYAAALKLGLLGSGTAPVEIERLTFQDIRSGAWRREGVPSVAEAPQTEPAATPAVAHADTGTDVSADASVVASSAAVAAPSAVATALPTELPATGPAEGASAPSATVATPAVSPGAAVDAGADAGLPPEQHGRAYTKAARGFWVQLGAFKRREGAESFQRRVAREFDALSPLLAIFDESTLFRLQAGPYATRDEARQVAGRVRDTLRLVPVIVERR